MGILSGPIDVLLVKPVISFPTSQTVSSGM